MTDRQTRTQAHCYYRGCIASRGKKHLVSRQHAILTHPSSEKDMGNRQEGKGDGVDEKVRGGEEQ